jgi:hypothetical protein
MSLVIQTLSDLIENRFGVTAFCETCRHSVELDLRALSERLGPGFVAIGYPNPLAARLSCAKCSGKEISLILSPESVPKPTASHNRSR